MSANLPAGFFEPSGDLARELCRMQFRGCQQTYEEASRPFRTDPATPCRDISPRSKEGKLRVLGWRIVPVPRFASPMHWARLALCWDNPAEWLAIPPGDDLPAGRFPSRRAALGWAEEQVGMR